MRQKNKCDECSRYFRNLILVKGKFICRNCFKKYPNYMSANNSPHSWHLTLERALNKIYEIKGYKDKKRKHFYGYRHFPKILIGHKVKLILVDE